MGFFTYPLGVFHMTLWKDSPQRGFERGDPFKNTGNVIGQTFFLSHVGRTRW